MDLFYISSTFTHSSSHLHAVFPLLAMPPSRENGDWPMLSPRYMKPVTDSFPAAENTAECAWMRLQTAQFVTLQAPALTSNALDNRGKGNNPFHPDSITLSNGKRTKTMKKGLVLWHHGDLET